MRFMWLFAPQECMFTERRLMKERKMVLTILFGRRIMIKQEMCPYASNVSNFFVTYMRKPFCVVSCQQTLSTVKISVSCWTDEVVMN